MHGTVRVLQQALPRLPQVLLFQVYLSKPTSPRFASKPPIATEHISGFSIQQLVHKKAQRALPRDIQTTEVAGDALHQDRPGRNTILARQM
jgi:hypothetical protein